MKLCRFNEKGRAAFAEYRIQLFTEPSKPPPKEWLLDPSLVEVIEPELEIAQRDFATRLEAGCFLYDLIGKTTIKRPEKDPGLWIWLTLFFFEQVCPADSHGNRQPLEEARLIPLVDNFRRFYRHLLLGPFLVVRAHAEAPERALSFLSNPLHTPGEIAAQLTSRLELLTNPVVIELATKYYYDTSKKTFYRGAAGSVKGAARRLATVLGQLDVTWYLYGLSVSELDAILPKEFDRFRR